MHKARIKAKACSSLDFTSQNSEDHYSY